MSVPESRRVQPGDGKSRPSLTPVSLLIVLLIFYVIVQIQIIVFLLLFALIFATIIERPVIKLESRGMPRAAGILTVYVVILMSLVLLGLIFVPLITSEARTFSKEAPGIIDNISSDWRTSDNQFLSRTGYRFLTQLKFRLENPPPPTGGTAIGLITGVGTAIFGIVATFVIGFYYLMEKHLFKRLILQNLEPGTQERVNTIWNDVEAKVGDWLRGQLILCVIIGTLSAFGYGLIGLRFWLLLAFFAGVTEAIPVIGPWIGGVPAFIIALLDSWQTATIVAIFIVMLQLLENSVLVPRVMKGAIGLSPLTVFLAVLAGGQFMGPLGALLAIPFAAAIQVVISDALRARRERFELVHADVPATPGTPPWRSVLTQFLGEGEGHSPHVPPESSEASNSHDKNRAPDISGGAGDT